ncbi:MAG: preprotein translocase subunit SecG [Candidatus Dasytiphilus stammeri]
MYETFLTFFIIIAIILISLIMLQQGNGADMISSSNYAASTIFRSHVSGKFLNRIITVLGIMFIIISLFLDNINSNGGKWYKLSHPTEVKGKFNKKNNTTPVHYN